MHKVKRLIYPNIWQPSNGDSELDLNRQDYRIFKLLDIKVDGNNITNCLFTEIQLAKEEDNMMDIA